MLAASKYVPHLPELAPLIAEAEARCDGTVAGFAQRASDLIHERFQYVKGATHVNSSIADSLQMGAGVCQDFAHLLLGVLRKRGIPARYVSGYLVPQNEENPAAKLEEVIGGQASHAWAEAYVPDADGCRWIRRWASRLGCVTCASRTGAITPTWRRCAACTKATRDRRLSVDVSVRPALDDEGHETLSETAAVPLEPEPEEPRAQQSGQQ